MSFRIITSRVFNGEIECVETKVSELPADHAISVAGAVSAGYHVAVWKGKKLLQYAESK